jgi:hypothetical protein
MDLDGNTKLSEVDVIAENSQPYAEYKGVVPTASLLDSSKKYHYIPDD